MWSRWVPVAGACARDPLLMIEPMSAKPLQLPRGGGALLVVVTWGLPLLPRNSVPAAALLQAQVLRTTAAAAELHQLHQPEHVL